MEINMNTFVQITTLLYRTICPKYNIYLNCTKITDQISTQKRDYDTHLWKNLDTIKYHQRNFPIPKIRFRLTRSTLLTASFIIIFDTITATIIIVLIIVGHVNREDFPVQSGTDRPSCELGPIGYYWNRWAEPEPPTARQIHLGNFQHFQHSRTMASWVREGSIDRQRCVECLSPRFSVCMWVWA